MRRAERLFQIVQILRRARGPVTADTIAAELETSKRSVYRDIAALIGQRVPVRGEAGIGYVLDRGFDLPPLMLTSDEVEAVVLGAQWVVQRGDAALARAARDLIAKIEAIVPETLRPHIEDPALRAPPVWNSPIDSIDMTAVRAAIHGGRKIALDYRDLEGRASTRTIWPIAIGYRDAGRTIVGWCELRQDFRHFRADRVESAVFLDTRYPERPGTLRARWRRIIASQMVDDVCPAAISAEQRSTDPSSADRAPPRSSPPFLS